jgi:hypothetical protein
MERATWLRDGRRRATNRHMGREEDGYITYGAFRNFLMLLPPERRMSDLDASLAWFEAATFVPLMPPVRKGASGAALVMAAVAGGLASGTSTATMHPLDTIKTQVQASVGKLTLQDVVSRWNSLGKQVRCCCCAPGTL